MLNKLIHAMMLTFLLSLFVGKGSWGGNQTVPMATAPALRYAHHLNLYPLVSPGNDLN